MKKILTMIVALTVLLVLAVPAAPSCFAKETTYTVKVYPGKKGSLNADTEYADHQYRDTFKGNVTIGDISVKDDTTYYVKGFRLTGHDKKEYVTTLSGFQVTRDLTYEVVYGVKGEMVAYTVRYVDDSGKAVSSEDVYYGKVGDKPTVAYKYLQTYMPVTYTMAKTLSANPEENVFEFIYTSVGRKNRAPVNPVAPLSKARENAAGDESSEEASGPVQFVDLDGDEAVPPEPRTNEKKSKLPIVLGIIGAIILAAMVACIAILSRRMKRKYRNY